MIRRTALFLALVLGFSSLAGAAAKRPFTFEDMMKLKRIGEPVVSPDGRWALFTAQHVSLEENKRVRHQWVVPLAGGQARQLTSGAAGEDRGRFSPDGKHILYHSAEDGTKQVYVAEFDAANGGLAGEPRQLTSLSTGADGATWSPDGKHILFTSEVYPDCQDDACNQARDEQKAKSKVKARLWTRLFYRHWSTYSEGKRTHLFLVPVEGGLPVDLTPGDHDVPPFSLGGQDMYAFSPDGQEIAYTSNIDEVEATSTNTEIFILPIGGKPRKISLSKGADSTPLYSPDGKSIAWRMQVRAGYESDRWRLVLYDRKTGKIANLTERFDRWVESFVWSPDSKRLYFTAEDKGEAPIYGISVKGGNPWEIHRWHNGDLAITPDGKWLVYTRMSLQAPNEIYKTEAHGEKPVPVKLTDLNGPVFAEAHTSPAEPFWFRGAENVRVHGLIVKPPDFDPAKKYPVKFLIHGGPQGAWADAWTYRWNAQLFAAGGYVVVMVNPRGSTGFGQKFVDDINADWGGRAYTDLMLGLDYVGRKFPWADTSRACAMGASFGGYMVNWMAGHTTRFKCFVSHDGTFNTESAYGTTEELWFPEWEFRGTPWSNRLLYRKWSPHLYAAQFKTPMLVVHGQLDYRLDVSEGFQLFTTLQRLKVPSKMLYFPDEGHWVLKPQNSQLWYQTVNEWVDEWVKK